LHTPLLFFALFCTHKKDNHLIFNRFHALRQKRQPPRLRESTAALVQSRELLERRRSHSRIFG
jgi:hypothetical protein